MVQNLVDIYIRLSDQDRDKKNGFDESESIQNQRKMLVDYCKKRKWTINGIYCDEDYSGGDRRGTECLKTVKSINARSFFVKPSRVFHAIWKWLKNIYTENFLNGVFVL